MINSKMVTTILALGLVASAGAHAESQTVLTEQELNGTAQVITEMMKAGLLVQDENGDLKVDNSFKAQLQRSGRLQSVVAKDGGICQ